MGVEQAGQPERPAMAVGTQTPPPTVTVGAGPQPAPRPDLNGSLLTPPNGGPVYTVIWGFLHWIPDPTTFNNLFRSWNDIVKSTDLPSIPQFPPLTSGALLIQAAGQAPVYLLTNGLKNWITSPAAMDKYHFNWGRILVLPPVVVNAIPTGSHIDA